MGPMMGLNILPMGEEWAMQVRGLDMYRKVGYKGSENLSGMMAVTWHLLME